VKKINRKLSILNFEALKMPLPAAGRVTFIVVAY